MSRRKLAITERGTKGLSFQELRNLPRSSRIGWQVEIALSHPLPGRVRNTALSSS